MATRKQRQAELIYELGVVLSPLRDIVEHPDYDMATRSRVAAKYSAGAEKFWMEVWKFSQEQPDHLYIPERQRFREAMTDLGISISQNLQDINTFKIELEYFSSEMREGILAISIIPADTTLVAHTPFSSYSFIKDLCQTTSQRLVLTDRYVDMNIYYRYLRDLMETVQVTLVTWPETRRKRSDWAELMDVSRMYAVEKVFTNYRFVVNDNFHDRRLWLDDQIYLLGGSLKDAGKSNDLTVGKLDNISQIRQEIEDDINNGTELFGPSHQTHP